MRKLNPLSTQFSWPRQTVSPDFVGDVFEDFDRIFNSFLRPTIASPAGFQPSYDVNETQDHYLVSFDMPGVKKEDIKIEVQANQLLVSGERQREIRGESEDSALRYERSYGKFERTFALPTSVNADKIEAHYENGVLSVALPKADATKGRTIQIQSGQDGFFSKLLGSKKEDPKAVKDVKIS